MANLGQDEDGTGLVRQVFSSECEECEILAHWQRTTGRRRGLEEWQPLDTKDSFVCPHWEDHAEALNHAVHNPSGRGGAGPVKARRLSRPPQPVGGS